jgi:hypothetical protein
LLEEEGGGDVPVLASNLHRLGNDRYWMVWLKA